MMDSIFKCLFLCAIVGFANANLCSQVTCESSFERCVGNTTHATCVCSNGYYRAPGNGRCELECYKFFCFHKGTCENGPNGRVCRCTSQNSGDRCENERKVTVQIAVGASVTGLVLVIALALILKSDSKTKSAKSRPWDPSKKHNETVSVFVPEMETDIERERGDSKPSASTQSFGSDKEPGASHTYCEIADLAKSASGSKYEVVADVNISSSGSSDASAASGDSAEAEEAAPANVDETGKTAAIEDAAKNDVEHAYVNNVAEENVKEDEEQDERCDANEESTL